VQVPPQAGGEPASGQQPAAVDHEIDSVHVAVREQKPTTSSVVAIRRTARERPRVTRELARRALVDRERLLALVDKTPVGEEMRARIRADIAADFTRRRRRDAAR